MCQQFFHETGKNRILGLSQCTLFYGLTKKSKHMRTNNTIADAQLKDIIDNYRGETRDWWKLVNEDAPKRSSSFFVHCP